MRRSWWSLSRLLILAHVLPYPALTVKHPDTRVDPVTDVIHGRRVVDPYRWLERADEPEVQAWMAAQDQHAREHLRVLPGRERLRARLEELSYFESLSPPVGRKGRLFYWRRRAHEEKAVFCVREAGAERVILDPNRMSEDGTVSVREAYPSPDGRLLAYKQSENNADAATLHIIEVDTGRERGRIAGAMLAQPAWTPDSAGFYYVRLPEDPAIPRDRLIGHADVRFHVMDTDPGGDVLVAPATGDASIFLGVELSDDGRYLFVTHQRGWVASDVYFRELEPGEHGRGVPGRLRTLAAGNDATYAVVAWRDAFYVHTNEGASRYRVFRVDPMRPAREHWTEIVAATDATLEEVRVIAERLLLVYLRDAHSEVRVCGLDGSACRTVDLPDMGTVSGLSGKPGDETAYLAYSSFIRSPEVYALAPVTGELLLWHKVELPVDTRRFRVDQVWYRSRDGTRVSMFIVHRDDLRRDGENPALLTGYGGFSVSMTPQFSSRAVMWLEQGGIYAVPNLRGGGEYGEEWHRAGMRENKQNVFDDFIAAAEHLVAEGYTRPGKLAIAGGSNGGLLVGATMVQRPDLMRVVVCTVPLLDMIRYHLFGLGRAWIPEYGSADDPAEFATLMAYSPYHHVREDVAYPAVLMLSADSDDRVDPMHARKFVARLQASRASALPVWLRIEKHAGHGGADSIRAGIERDADVYAFLSSELGAGPEHAIPRAAGVVLR